jgi:ATP-dependent RNA helicase SUPV3L1/SUV3
LPIRDVVIAETTKFDGTQRRTLKPWELAQIVGRAGRYGLVDEGRVWVLGGAEGFSPDGALVKRAVEVAAGRQNAKPISTGTIRPTLGDLGCGRADQLPATLTRWLTHARKELKQHQWLRAWDPAPLLARYQAAHDAVGKGRIRQLDLDAVWRLISLPVDPGHVVASATRCLAGVEPSLTHLLVTRFEYFNLGDAERQAAVARDLRALSHGFDGLGGLTAAAASAMEDAASQRIAQLLASGVTHNTYGRCQSCADSCPPWYPECDRCHRSRRWDEWAEEDFDW